MTILLPNTLLCTLTIVLGTELGQHTEGLAGRGINRSQVLWEEGAVRMKEVLVFPNQCRAVEHVHTAEHQVV